MPADLHTFDALQARFGKERYRWLLLLAVMTGTMASIMSSTIVNVAIPDLSRHFALDQARAQWVGSGFMIATTVAMLTTPSFLARFGARRTYIAAMLLLAAGGLLGGFAGHYSLVLAARAAEGLAAGVVQPIPVVVILRLFGTKEQGRASGIFGMGVVLAPAIGPSIGGVLVDWFGWRSIFFMVVPFCALSIAMAQRYVPDAARGGNAPPRAAGRFDLLGLLIAAAGIVCLLNGLVELHAGGLAAALPLGAAALALALFITWQRHLARARREPLLNLAVFGVRPFTMGSIVSFIYGAALFGSTYLLPVYMQVGLGLSASWVGAILLPAGLVLAVAIGTVGRLADRQPTWLLVGIGIALLAASFGLTATLRLHDAIGWLVAWTILGRIGLGFILPSLNLGSLRPVPKELVSQGSSLINFMRMLGGAMGVSICGIVLEWRIAAHGAVLGATPPSAARLAALNETFVMLAALCVLALVASTQLRDRAAPP